MRKVIMAGIGASMLALGGCATGTTPIISPTDVANAEKCSLDLLESGLVDPAALATTALTDPACAALATDVVQNIISQIPTKAAAMRARGLRPVAPH